MPSAVVGSSAVFLFACGGFLAVVGVFFLCGRANICGGTLSRSDIVFVALRAVFSARCCVLSVGFAFMALCNALKTVCIAFCLIFDISYRLNFCARCRLFFWHCEA